MGRKPRFPGAGGAAESELNRVRKENIRAEWRVWLAAGAAVAGFAIWAALIESTASKVLAGVAGAIFGAFFVIWAIGGHASAFPWLLGSEGEKETGRQIERLDGDWYCEHAITHEHGDWDHVLIGPPGVFLVDTKNLSRTTVATHDSLRSGRLVHHGGVSRRAAVQLKEALEGRLGRKAPWVHAVVAVWGDFPQGRYEEEDVVYIAGQNLVTWLTELPPKLTAPDRAALVVALQELRAELVGSRRGAVSSAAAARV